MDRTRAVVLLFGLVAAVTGSVDGARAATGTADVEDYRFSPSEVRIEPGDRVRWTNRGDQVHTVTSDDPGAEDFDSGRLGRGDEYTHTFSKPGRFTYHCEVHSSMSGVVQVGSPPTTTTRPPPTTTSSTTTTTRPTTTTSSTTTTVNPLICDGRQATIIGTAGNDTIVGTAGPDVIVGLGGDDELRGGDGDDRLLGMGGNDTLIGGNGNDRIEGGDGNDTIRGGGAPDDLVGGPGRDRLNGGG